VNAGAGHGVSALSTNPDHARKAAESNHARRAAGGVAAGVGALTGIGRASRAVAMALNR
jgi:hypothetical protein